MKATGIVRRIDDLGRVVIPKEIRRTMRIREGDPLEIYTTRDGEVIFKKYSLIGGLEDFAAQFCDTLSRNTDFTAAVTDRDSIVAVAGAGKRELLGKNLSPQLEQIMEQRSIYQYRSGQERLAPSSTPPWPWWPPPSCAAATCWGWYSLSQRRIVSPARGSTSWPKPWRAFWASTWRPDCKGSRESDALPAPFARLSQQPEGSMDQHTDRHPHRRRQHHGQQRPPPVSRRMVRQVVPQGKCSRHRAIIHRAVSVVQPLCSKMARSASSPLHSVSVPVCR